MDRFDAMRILLATVDAGSLSGGSRSLRMPLPTVSRKVSELEAHLGTRLLVRARRGLLLTEAGSAFVEASRRLLGDLQEAERAASGEYRTPRGELRVTASIMFGKMHVAPMAIAFMQAFSEVQVRLVLADNVVDLPENHLDVAIRIGPLPDSSLVARRVGSVHWMTCASPDYLARRGIPKTPDDLLEHDCIAFEGLQQSRSWVFGNRAKPVHINPRYSVNTADAVIDAASVGVGVARVTSYQAAQAIQAGALVSVLSDYVPDHLPVHLVHSGHALLPLKTRAFLDFAMPRLRSCLLERL